MLLPHGKHVILLIAASKLIYSLVTSLDEVISDDHMSGQFSFED